MVRQLLYPVVVVGGGGGGRITEFTYRAEREKMKNITDLSITKRYFLQWIIFFKSKEEVKAKENLFK